MPPSDRQADQSLQAVKAPSLVLAQLESLKPRFAALESVYGVLYEYPIARPIKSTVDLQKVLPRAMPSGFVNSRVQDTLGWKAIVGFPGTETDPTVPTPYQRHAILQLFGDGRQVDRLLELSMLIGQAVCGNAPLQWPLNSKLRTATGSVQAIWLRSLFAWAMHSQPSSALMVAVHRKIPAPQNLPPDWGSPPPGPKPILIGTDDPPQGATYHYFSGEHGQLVTVVAPMPPFDPEKEHFHTSALNLADASVLALDLVLHTNMARPLLTTPAMAEPRRGSKPTSVVPKATHTGLEPVRGPKPGRDSAKTTLGNAADNWFKCYIDTLKGMIREGQIAAKQWSARRWSFDIDEVYRHNPSADCEPVD